MSYLIHEDKRHPYFAPMTTQLKLLDQVRNVIRLKHYSYETEKTYINWIKRFIAFHNMTPPREMGAPQVEG